MTDSPSCGLATALQLSTQSTASFILSDTLMDVPEITEIAADPRVPFTSVHPQTHYLAVSPPTPAPSPGPGPNLTPALCHPSVLSLDTFSQWPPNSAIRRQFLAALLSQCSSSELHFISTTLANLLKRDFLHDLPAEIALHILSFVDDHQSLIHAGQVSRHWRSLTCDPRLWKRLCEHYHYRFDGCNLDESAEEMMPQNSLTPDLEWLEIRQRLARQTDRYDSGIFVPPCPSPDSSLVFSYYKHFKRAYMTMSNWRRGGRLLRAHRVPIIAPDSGVVTSLALDPDWIVVGLANSRIHIFSTRTGVLARTLIGHDSGVWAVHLVGAGGYWGEQRPQSEEIEEDGSIGMVPAPLLSVSTSAQTGWRDEVGGSGFGKKSNPCCSSEGWGQPLSIVVSGGCDKTIKVWDVKTGFCLHSIEGHTSTIRCLRVLHNRPVAVTGSRDATLRVWDVQRGRLLRVLEGHTESVRSLDVCGNKAVSGSYDTTCRLWDLDTGECIHVLRGHFYRIYTVAFDGERIASGGLDTTVRLWDASSGQCIALLQGHSALVCQLQLSSDILATGGSDGRVITFSLRSYRTLHRIMAHSSSVTSLQFDRHFLITGGADGHVKLFETRTGAFVRELTEKSDGVWKVASCGDVCAIMCQRPSKISMEMWSFKPREDS